MYDKFVVLLCLAGIASAGNLVSPNAEYGIVAAPALAPVASHSGLYSAPITSYDVPQSVVTSTFATPTAAPPVVVTTPAPLLASVHNIPVGTTYTAPATNSIGPPAFKSYAAPSYSYQTFTSDAASRPSKSLSPPVATNNIGYSPSASRAYLPPVSSPPKPAPQVTVFVAQPPPTKPVAPAYSYQNFHQVIPQRKAVITPIVTPTVAVTPAPVVSVTPAPVVSVSPVPLAVAAKSVTTYVAPTPVHQYNVNTAAVSYAAPAVQTYSVPSVQTHAASSAQAYVASYVPSNPAQQVSFAAAAPQVTYTAARPVTYGAVPSYSGATFNNQGVYAAPSTRYVSSPSATYVTSPGFVPYSAAPTYSAYFFSAPENTYSVVPRSSYVSAPSNYAFQASSPVTYSGGPVAYRQAPVAYSNGPVFYASAGETNVASDYAYVNYEAYPYKKKK